MPDTDQLNNETDPKDVSFGVIKGQTTSTGATMYDGLENAHMSFSGIGCLEAISGDVVLRGRNGQRDVLFPLERAVQRYFEWMDLTTAYARNAVEGWTEMMDIAQDFKAKICEAVAQRKKENMPIPENAAKVAGLPPIKKEG